MVSQLMNLGKQRQTSPNEVKQYRWNVCDQIFDHTTTDLGECVPGVVHDGLIVVRQPPAVDVLSRHLVEVEVLTCGGRGQHSQLSQLMWMVQLQSSAKEDACISLIGHFLPLPVAAKVF